MTEHLQNIRNKNPNLTPTETYTLLHEKIMPEIVEKKIDFEMFSNALSQYEDMLTDQMMALRERKKPEFAEDMFEFRSKEWFEVLQDDHARLDSMFGEIKDIVRDFPEKNRIAEMVDEQIRTDYPQFYQEYLEHQQWLKANPERPEQSRTSMAESRLESERPVDVGRFGLAANVSEAVTDYYDLLFDYVKEYISHNEEGRKEYEQENAELAAKLAGGDLDPAEELAIRNTMRINTAQISDVNDFLNSDIAHKVAIDFSVDVLDGTEPELADRFKAAPVTEKYACLVNHYMEEYRADLETRVNLSQEDSIGASFDVDSHRRDRPSAWNDLTSLGSAGRQWSERLDALEQTAADKKKDWQDLEAYAGTSSLVEIDAFRFGVEKTKDVFPDIAEQHQEHRRGEYKELLEADPVRLYSDLIMEYSTAHVADMGEQLSRLQDDRDARQSLLREHDAAKPDWVKNLATLGNAEKTWKAEREVLAREIAGIKEQMAEVQQNREECREGWLSESARNAAKQMLLSRNPEVAEACDRHMARHWKESNEARLAQQKERQAGRESGNEQSTDKGLSR